VWNHLLENINDTKILKCKYCEVQFKSHSTTSLTYHMQHKHNLLLEPASGSSSVARNSSQKLVSTFFQKQNSCPGYILAKLTALDKIPFSTLANSDEIKKGWEARGLKMPLTRQGIKKVTLEYADQMRKKLLDDFKKRIENGERFSLSMDEWSSKKIDVICV
jgi:hypothetical protein